MFARSLSKTAVKFSPRTFSTVPTGAEVMESLASSSLTEDQLAYRDLARNFAEAELSPHAARWDRDSFFPVDTLRQAANLGFGAM
jgi:alkylation response protein AidB-like acyl-CoA dehydrogenase